MSTTAEKLNKLLNTKAAIASALEEVGQEGGTVFSTYADQIRNIPAKVGSLCVTMTPAESPDPETTVFEADATYEQVLEAYAAGRFVYANVPLGDAYVVAPIMLSQDGQIGFGAYTGDSFLLLIMGQDSENLAIMQTIEMTEQLGIREHFINDNNPHNVTAAQVGAVATGDFSSLLETELQDAPNITMNDNNPIIMLKNPTMTNYNVISVKGFAVVDTSGSVELSRSKLDFDTNSFGNKGTIANLADPTNDNDAANKKYVDDKTTTSAIKTALKNTTITIQNELDEDDEEVYRYFTAKSSDGKITNKLGNESLIMSDQISGTAAVLGTSGLQFTTNVSGSKTARVTGLAAPAEDDHAANKAYVDSKYSYGTEDLTAGTSPLESGKLYFVYE